MKADKVKELVKTLTEEYIVNRNFHSIIDMVDENITWVGLGEYAVSKGIEETKKSLTDETFENIYSVNNFNLNVVSLLDNYYLVNGEFVILSESIFSAEEKSCSKRILSCICYENAEGKLVIYFYQISVSNHQYNSTENLLQKTSQQFDTFANNINGGLIICEYDDFFSIHEVTPGFEALTGYTKEEIFKLKEGKEDNIIVPEDFEDVKNQVAEQLKSGNVFTCEYRIIRKDGTFLWVLDRGFAITYKDGSIKLQSVLINIDEQKKREEELRFSQKRYEKAVELLDITMFEYNLDTKAIILFEKDAAMYGLETVTPNGVEEFIKRGIVDSDSVDDFREMYRKIHAGEPYAKCMISTKDIKGKEHSFEVSLTNVFDKSGKPMGAIGVRKNISERRRLEREDAFGKTLASDKNYLWEADVTNNQITFINNAWKQKYGIVDIMKYDKLVNFIIDKISDLKYKNLIREKLDKDFLNSQYEKSQGLISFQFKSKEEWEALWFKATLNIVKDDFQNKLHLRFYIEDITDKKDKEQKAEEMQKLYENMVSKVLIGYEVNVTQNKILSDIKQWTELFDANVENGFNGLLSDFCRNCVHIDDRNKFIKFFDSRKIIKDFIDGQREASLEYRRLKNKNEMIWVNCLINIFEDPMTGDIKYFAYVEDIDHKKQVELDLIYKAEHDALTGCLNKSTIEKRIEEFLQEEEGQSNNHALLIIDIDFFKTVNDTLGHVFGDAVLSQVSSKILKTFKESDLIGRIGGDEFCVFMKNINSWDSVMKKCAKLCRNIAESYQQGDKVVSISCSIGIAIYSDHGLDYKKLYLHADSALYVSKKKGRNQYTMFENNMKIMQLEAKQIVENPLLEIKNFKENMSEYVFRILYDSQDKEASLNAVLALVGKQLNISRVYIFEDSEDGTTTSNTFEWCNQGVSPKKEISQNIKYSDLGDYKNNFNEDGIFIVTNIDDIELPLKHIVKEYGVKSLLQFSIKRYHQFTGFIGFEHWDKVRVYDKTEILEYYNIARTLGMFITEMRSIERIEAIGNSNILIVNALDSFIYVCNPETYEILFINDKIKEIIGGVGVGDKCYSAFWDMDSPCEICPMRALKESSLNKYSMDMYNTKLELWIKATASWIKWKKGERVCFIDSVDITKYVKD